MEIRARVILQEKGMYTISYEGKERYAEVSGRFRYDARMISDFPAVGDYVVATWPEDGSNSIINSLFPRKSVFIRKAAGTNKQEQVVAANVDTVFICMSLNNDFNLRRLERYLAITWESGANPVVVLTKADLCQDIEAKIKEVESISTGTDIIVVSSILNDYDAAKKYIVPGNTVAFMGSSGVGKSTLINRLIGDDYIKTSGIRNDDKGRHTTTHRELIVLENGCSVIDTPGMRELGMWNNEAGIDSVFSDIEDLAEKCRFSDCTHTSEPGCAILLAMEDGTLDIERLQAYRKLKAENLYAVNESEYLQVKKEKFKQISKYNKKNRKSY